MLNCTAWTKSKIKKRIKIKTKIKYLDNERAGASKCLVIAAHVRKTTETKIGKHILRSIHVHMDMAKNPKTLKPSHVYSIAPISLSFHQHDTGPHFEIWVMGSAWIVRSERSVGVANSHLCVLISINRSLSISMIIKAHFISPAYLLSPAVFDFTFQILLSLSHDLFMRKRIPCLSFWS